MGLDRFQRLRRGGEELPLTIVVAHPDSNRDSYCDADRDAHRDRDSDHHPNVDADRNCDLNGNPNRDPGHHQNSDADRGCDTDSDRGANIRAFGQSITDYHEDSDPEGNSDPRWRWHVERRVVSDFSNHDGGNARDQDLDHLEL